MVWKHKKCTKEVIENLAFSLLLTTITTATTANNNIIHNNNDNDNNIVIKLKQNKNPCSETSMDNASHNIVVNTHKTYTNIYLCFKFVI